MDYSSKRPLWHPGQERIEKSGMNAFREWCAYEFKTEFPDHAAFHKWSVDDPIEFWRAVWTYCGIRGAPGARVLVDGSDMMKARFFPDASMNFAENLLSRTGSDDAIVFRGEDKAEDRWSWDRLYAEVSSLQQFLRATGVSSGDRVAAMLPNMPETVALMLATASIGAVWSSCSPDFGEKGVIDRFGQIEPKLFISCDAYWYGGKCHDVSEKVRSVASQLGCPVLVVHYAGDAEVLSESLAKAQTYDPAVAAHEPGDVEFPQFPFSHPLYILFSSGTTGVPKCIVHSAGGTLLQHVKEHRFHCDLRPGDRMFYFTTCGWMMWNWLVSGLASGVTLCLFDGSPTSPDAGVLWRYAADEGVSFFGTSAKYIDILRKEGFVPAASLDLSPLRTVASTGSPLSAECFDYVYRSIKSDVQLASVSGGTDIVSCFVLGNPVLPVWRGEIQGPGLGLAVDVWDEAGNPVKGEKGELVCTRPFPCMPMMFWNDPGNEKYRASYFGRFDNVWCHGDFAEWTEHGGMVIHGRSDATLNPGGVRIGTAEIYNQVDQLPEVAESICVGQDYDGDVRILLFVKLVGGLVLDQELEAKIRLKIRQGASPRHVPAKILQVRSVPRTKSGKLVELAVRNVIHGLPVNNVNTLDNPASLHEFVALRELLQ